MHFPHTHVDGSQYKDLYYIFQSFMEIFQNLQARDLCDGPHCECASSYLDLGITALSKKRLKFALFLSSDMQCDLD